MARTLNHRQQAWNTAFDTTECFIMMEALRELCGTLSQKIEAREMGADGGDADSTYLVELWKNQKLVAHKLSGDLSALLYPTPAGGE